MASLLSCGIVSCDQDKQEEKKEGFTSLQGMGRAVTRDDAVSSVATRAENVDVENRIASLSSFESRSAFPLYS